MGRVLPILFNAEMVRAILDGRKTVTRRVIKPRYRNDECDFQVVVNKATGERRIGTLDADGFVCRAAIRPPYQPGDILYVRETYCPDYLDYRNQYGNKHGYRADYEKAILTSDIPEPKWTAAIHMPKEAARIWLKVMEVRVERLQEISDEQARREGAGGVRYDVNTGQEESAALEWFPIIWDSTIKRTDHERYGWKANPWVWVIGFERCGKTESEG